MARESLTADQYVRGVRDGTLTATSAAEGILRAFGRIPG